MKLTQFVDEDFANYRVASMFLGTTACDGKCYVERGLSMETCQNCELMKMDGAHLNVPNETLIERYRSNPITHAVVIGGLEPLLTWDETRQFLLEFRAKTSDTIVIYTGYNKDEVMDKVVWIHDNIPNVIMKFGRYIPDAPNRFDEVLGVTLASDNQYAEVISDAF